MSNMLLETVSMIGKPDDYYDADERKSAHSDMMQAMECARNSYEEEDIARGICTACGVVMVIWTVTMNVGTKTKTITLRISNAMVHGTMVVTKVRWSELLGSKSLIMIDESRNEKFHVAILTNKKRLMELLDT